MQDLLDPSTSRDITVREKSNGETFVEGLCRVHVEDAAAAISVLEGGERHRAKTCDSGNESSSRSHAIALVYLDQHSSEGKDGQEDVLTQVK